MFEEVNTGNNLPVQFDIMAAPGEHHADELHLMFVAKGGGSANKTFLFQETRAILQPGSCCSNSSRPRSRRSAPRPARPTTSRSSSAAPRPRLTSRR